MGNIMKLFVSDLDGTLLNKEQKLSPYSIETINRLIHSGMQFSVATARSIVSAGRVIKPLELKLPVIVHNGVFIYDPVCGKNIQSHLMHHEDAGIVLNVLKQYEVLPLIYTINRDGEYKVYYSEIQNKGQEDYINDRIGNGDKRITRIEDLSRAVEEDIITIVAIDTESKLKPAYETLKSRNGLGFNFSEDIYTHFFWLEITHFKANKKDAVLALKELVKADELITFGDNLNDIPMFEASDFCCAVENAYEQVRKAASKVISCNNEDGVVRFLDSFFKEH